MSNKTNDLVNAMVDAVEKATKKRTSGYDTSAVVRRVEGDTVWVHIPGGVDETPVKKTINAKAGDTVQVRLSGGHAFIIGNASAPPTDDRTAEEAKATAKKAVYTAETALEDAVVAHEAAESATASAATAGRAASVAQAAAEAAQETANTKRTVFVAQPMPPYHVGDLWVREGDEETTSSLVTDQGFNIVDSDGNLFEAVIKGATVYVCVFARSSGSFVESDWSLAATDNTSVNELREWFWHDSLGAHVLGDATGYRNDITSTGMQIIDTSTETSVATFGASGAQIGRTGAAHSVIDANGQRVYASNGTTQIANLGYGQGYNAQGQLVDAPYYTLGTRGHNWIGNYSVSEGNSTDASSFASHSEGYQTLADSNYAHAEGYGTTSSGQASHAEGRDTTTSALYAHAEGYSTTASGKQSHAEGDSTTASGENSHAQNLGTTAAYDNQTVIGKYNDNKSGNIFEIGYGTSGTPTNVFEVDTSGNVEAAGDITDGNGNVLSDKADASSVVTPDDYVIAHGTSGSWRYRKWNSGKIEAWFSGSVTSDTGATVVTAPIYRGTWSLSIPSQIGFASAPNILITNNYEPTNVISINGRATSATAISGNFFRVDNQQSTVTLYTRIYAWGVAS